MSLATLLVRMVLLPFVSVTETPARLATAAAIAAVRGAARIGKPRRRGRSRGWTGRSCGGLQSKRNAFAVICPSSSKLLQGSGVLTPHVAARAVLAVAFERGTCGS